MEMCVHGHSSPRPRMSTRHSKACRRHRITEQLWSCTNYSSAAANVGTTTLCTVKAGPACVLATSSRASAPAGADGGSVLVRRCFACGQVRCFACGRRAISHLSTCRFVAHTPASLCTSCRTSASSAVRRSNRPELGGSSCACCRSTRTARTGAEHRRGLSLA